MAKYKTTKIKTTIPEAFAGAKADIEELHQEIEDWKESMEDSEGLMATSKYETLEETTLALEVGCDFLSYIECELPNEELQVSMVSPYGKKGAPRWMRLANAVGPLEAIAERLEEIIEGNEVDEEPEIEESRINELEETVSYIHDVVGEVEMAEFPSMFG